MKGAIDALLNVDDDRVIINGDFIGIIFLGIFVLIVTCLTLLFTYLSKKRKQDLDILNTDLKTIDDDSLLDKYESTANKPTNKNN